MSKTTTTPTAADVEAMRQAAGRLFSAGREVKNYATDAERVLMSACQHKTDDKRRAEAIETLPGIAARLIANVEEQAAQLPALRELAGVKPEPVKLGGLVVAVKYHGANARSGARLVATIAALDPNDKPDVRISRAFDHGDPDMSGGARAIAQAALDRWNDGLRKSAPGCTCDATIRARGYHNGEHLFFCQA